MSSSLSKLPKFNANTKLSYFQRPGFCRFFKRINWCFNRVIPRPIYVQRESGRVNLREWQGTDKVLNRQVHDLKAPHQAPRGTIRAIAQERDVSVRALA